MKKSEDTMRILKTATCKTLSGKSTLTYQIGVTSDSVIHLRISKNDGGGFFSDEWISYDGIQEALKKRLKGQAITSYLLDPLYVGRSANNCSFLLAALVHLKLLRPLKGKKREHEPMDPRPFLDQVDKLTTAPVKKKAPTKKTAAKTVTRKTAIKKTGGSASIKKASIKKASVKKAAVKKKRSASTAKVSTD